MLRLMTETVIFAINRTQVLLWTSVLITGGVQIPIIATILLAQPWIYCGFSSFSKQASAELHKLHSLAEDGVGAAGGMNSSSG